MSPAKAIDALVQALGDDLVATGPGIPDRRHGDWSGVPYSVPLALLRPRNTEQLARMLHICNELGQPVVPQGGLTGLAGGACCGSGEVAVSLERMNAIEEIDAVSGTLTAQAGCTLQAVQEAAEAAGFLFALDLGARGTCTIGGNLSTNAGGNRVIRYGTMRDQLVGVEAVLADGSVVGGLHKMVKNNTGYDLRHLLAGAEGTLGIVTRVVLKLHPQPKSVSTAWCGLPDYDAVTILLQRAKAELPGGVSAFEVMWPNYLDFMLGKVKGLRAPLSRRHAMNVLMESAGAAYVKVAPGRYAPEATSSPDNLGGRGDCPARGGNTVAYLGFPATHMILRIAFTTERVSASIQPTGCPSVGFRTSSELIPEEGSPPGFGMELRRRCACVHHGSGL
jgi:FAD/FMN-containing dehydrogenase